MARKPLTTDLHVSLDGEATTATRVAAEVPVPPQHGSGAEGDGPGAEPPQKPKAPYPFASRYTSVVPRVNQQVGRIFESLFSCDDIWEEYRELKKALKVEEKFTDYLTLMRALNNAEDNARRAHKLYCNGELECKRFALAAKHIEAALRQSAIRELTYDKKAGAFDKRVTNPDVEAYILNNYSEEHERIEMDRKRHELMGEHLKELATIWKSRCLSLNTMVKKQRGGGGDSH